MKTCFRCGETHPLSAFTSDRTKRDGLHPSCRACLAASRRALHAALTPEQKAEKKRRDDARSLAWRLANPERYAARRKAYAARTSEAVMVRVRAWQKANPEKFKANLRASEHRRRSVIRLGATGPETRAWVSAQPKVCRWCAVDCEADFHVDHVMPLSRGGLHVVENLAIACPPCNYRKSNKLPEEFQAQMSERQATAYTYHARLGQVGSVTVTPEMIDNV